MPTYSSDEVFNLIQIFYLNHDGEGMAMLQTLVTEEQDGYNAYDKGHFTKVFSLMKRLMDFE